MMIEKKTDKYIYQPKYIVIITKEVKVQWYNLVDFNLQFMNKKKKMKIYWYGQQVDESTLPYIWSLFFGTFKL